jgi:hypothetical protein
VCDIKVSQERLKSLSNEKYKIGIVSPHFTKEDEQKLMKEAA